jgi:hypothetical protein
VDILKDDGRTRPLGIPTVADRVAQMVVKRALEPLVEPHFHDDSYGYRPGKSALDAVGVARRRCWRYDWVLDLDIKSFFDEIDRELLMRAEVRDSPSAAPKGDDACGRTPAAILLNARRTQTSKAMGLESVRPREELFLRQLIDLAGLLGGDPTAVYRNDHCGLTTYYPSAGVRRWQTFTQQRLGVKERIHGAAPRR